MTAKQRRLLRASITAEIVSSYLLFNKLPWKETTSVIECVLETLGGLQPVQSTPADKVAVKPAPAVSKKKSISDNHVYCLECGKGFKTIALHLHSRHKITTAEYRRKWDLSPDYPMSSPTHTAFRSSLAKSIGLGKRVERTVSLAKV